MSAAHASAARRSRRPGSATLSPHPAAPASGPALDQGQAPGSPDWYLDQALRVAPWPRVAAVLAELAGRPGGDSARDTFWTCAGRALTGARLAEDWARAANVYHVEARVAFLEGGAGGATDEKVKGLCRDWSRAAVRAIVARGGTTLVIRGGAGCCTICRADEGLEILAADPLAHHRLPHEACASGWCPCEWDTVD